MRLLAIILLIRFFFTINRSNYDCSIFINNADLLTISIPAHAPHYWLVSVVDHFLVPCTLERRQGDKETKRKSYKKLVSNKITCNFSLTAAITFVQHPHNNESILVTCCQLFILFVPRDHLYCTCKYNKCDVLHYFSIIFLVPCIQLLKIKAVSDKL